VPKMGKSGPKNRRNCQKSLKIAGNLKNQPRQIRTFKASDRIRNSKLGVQPEPEAACPRRHTQTPSISTNPLTAILPTRITTTQQFHHSRPVQRSVQSPLQVAHEVEEIRRMVSLPYTNRLVPAFPTPMKVVSKELM
jgi:hypothetical protein